MSSEVFTFAGIDKMVQSGALAVILGRFLDADGKEMTGPTHDRMLGLSLDELRDIPQRICLAGGLDKTNAILAALRGGFVTDLVIDLPTAEALMIQADGSR